MINCYLGILVALLAFFCAILLFLKKYYTPKSTFSAVPETKMQFEPATREIYLNDTRTKFAESPPVNPVVERSQILKVIPANTDLYTSQEYSINERLLDQPLRGSTNQLVYSGGNAEIIKIPLQFNVPFDEQLRSQEILVTDYNRIKYSSTCKNILS